MKFTHDPTPKQREALILLYNFTTKYILFGGAAGGGKSWIGCEWLLAMCLNFPGVRYFIGRKELKKLKDTTLKTFHKVSSHHGLKDYYRYSDHTSTITFNNGSEILLLDLKKQPSDPEFDDIGSLEFTGGFMDECSEVPFEAYDALKGRLGRQLNDHYNIPTKLLLTCNPRKNWLYRDFYKPWTKGELEDNMAFVKALVTDNDKIDSGYISNLDNIKDKVRKQRLRHGIWEYDDSDNSLISFDDIQDIFTNSHIEEGSDRCITADIARFGGDNTVIRVWYGFVVKELKIIEYNTIPEAADLIKEVASRHGIRMSRVIVDEDGIGGGVVDLLKCPGFVANSRAIDKDNFDNLKSQCGFRIAEIIKDIGVYEPCMDSLKDNISEELEQLKKKNIDSDKKNAIMPKEQIKAMIGRSPDHLDTYIMRAYFEINVVRSRPMVTVGSYHK